MYKITIDHLEQIQKALEHSIKSLETSAPKDKKAIAKNKKALDLINNEYLHIPS